MVRLEALAEAALAGESLRLRSLVQDFLREAPRLADIPKPEVGDPQQLALLAALLELFAHRRRQAAPAWTAEVGPAPEPVYLLQAAATMPRLRRLCEVESPEPLRRRRLYAPPNYLEFA